MSIRIGSGTVRLVSALSGSVYRIHHQFFGAFHVYPLADSSPFPGFKVLVVIEKVRDLLPHNLRQIKVGADIGIKRMKAIDRNRD